jgi:ATP-dependent exoDNAse (exonuclease V) beta subunit
VNLQHHGLGATIGDASQYVWRKIAPQLCQRFADYDPASDTIKVMTMKVSKGLEFAIVALPGVGHMPAVGEDETEAARVFYVAATRATQKLVIGVGGPSAFGQRLG